MSSSVVGVAVKVASRGVVLYRNPISRSTLQGQQWNKMPNFIINGSFVRSVKTTSTVHPRPVYDEEEKVLEKVLKERENSDDLPISLANPYDKPKRKCILCEHAIEPNYKNTKLLYQFVSPYTGMVYGRHITGLCKKMQEKVEAEARLATNFGFMSSYLKEVEFLKDPKLCDPERLVRPHKY